MAAFVATVARGSVLLPVEIDYKIRLTGGFKAIRTCRHRKMSTAFLGHLVLTMLPIAAINRSGQVVALGQVEFVVYCLRVKGRPSSSCCRSVVYVSMGYHLHRVVVAL